MHCPEFLNRTSLQLAAQLAHPLSDHLLRRMEAAFLNPRRSDLGQEFEGLVTLDTLLARIEPEAAELISLEALADPTSPYFAVAAVNFVAGLGCGALALRDNQGTPPWRPTRGAAQLLQVIAAHEPDAEFLTLDSAAHALLQRRLLRTFERIRSSEPTLVGQLDAVLQRVAQEWPRRDDGYGPQQWPRLFFLIGFASACVGQVAVVG